jgi:hypothetical protein
MYTVWDCINQIVFFYSCFCRSLVLILHVFRVCRVYLRSIFFTLVLILRIPAYLWIKEDRFFSDRFFFGRSFYVQIGVLQFVLRVRFYAKMNVTNLYVINLY